MAAQRAQCAAACCDDRWLLEACVDALPREQQGEWHRLKREYLKSVLASRERERAAKAEYERVVREVEARKERARKALRAVLRELGVRPEALGKKHSANSCTAQGGLQARADHELGVHGFANSVAVVYASKAGGRGTSCCASQDRSAPAGGQPEPRAVYIRHIV